MILSATQIQSFRRCQRLWWFDRVQDMPKASQAYGMVYGTVLHGVLERWLEADDTGRDPDGTPAEIFPPGWTRTPEGEEITPEDAQRIPHLLQQAIETGVIWRPKDRVVEHSFTRPLLPGVELTGRIDVFLPERGAIWDHKSVASMRWARSKNALAEDTQMLIYAAELPEHHETIRLRHNVFDRSPDGECKAVETTITRGQVNDHFRTVVADAEAMLALKSSGLSCDDWRDVPGALESEGAAKACGAYGGCRYLPICSRIERPERFRQRLLRARLPVAVALEKGMTLEEKLRSLSVNPKSPEERGEPAVTTDVSPADSQLSPNLEKTSHGVAGLPSLQGSGLVILHHCHAIQGDFGLPVHTLSSVLERIVTQAGDSMEAYWRADVWKRRDAVKALVPKAVEGLGAAVVTVNDNMTTDEKELFAALRPHAALVVAALR